MAKKRKKKKHHKKQSFYKQKRGFLTENPISLIAIKALLFVLMIVLMIVYSDMEGYFNPSQANNHTEKKWNSFYEFTKNNNVDILLLGNSHLYTGINPKTLSAVLGVNSFILASPGTHIIDTYFSLKEALKITKPKIVIIETYGINQFNPYEFKKGPLSEQLKSFSSRKDFLSKIISMPYLFKTDNYPYAWSNTLRNHGFLFSNQKQLKSFSARKDFLSKIISMPYLFKTDNYPYAWSNTLRNHGFLFSNQKQLILNRSPKKRKRKKDLYLGRYVRFTSGLKKDILKKYDSLGAPVKGSDYVLNEYPKVYTKKIIDLCKNNGIELIFLTLPMYYKHIENYSTWEKNLKKLLIESPNYWLNMQSPYDTTNFTISCFENTYELNQHMTYNGSLIATNKLAKFIKNKLYVNLPYRKKEQNWINNFYGQEGYFENNPVLIKDKKNKILARNFATNNVLIDEVSLLEQKKGKNKLLIAKITNNGQDLSKCSLILAINTSSLDKKPAVYNIKLNYDKLHRGLDFHVFKIGVKPLEIMEIKAGKLFCN